MSTRFQKLQRPLVGAGLFAVSLPLSLTVVDSLYGLASVLFPPMAVVAVIFMLVTRKSERRAFWFGFAVTLLSCLPFCPSAFGWLGTGANSLRDMFPALSPRVVEPVLLVAVVVVPFLLACALAVGGGRASRWIVCRVHESCASFRCIR